mgnify:CR=1 FL=1
MRKGYRFGSARAETEAFLGSIVYLRADWWLPWSPHVTALVTPWATAGHVGGRPRVAWFDPPDAARGAERAAERKKRERAGPRDAVRDRGGLAHPSGNASTRVERRPFFFGPRRGPGRLGSQRGLPRRHAWGP